MFSSGSSQLGLNQGHGLCIMGDCSMVDIAPDNEEVER